MDKPIRFPTVLVIPALALALAPAFFLVLAGPEALISWCLVAAVSIVLLGRESLRWSHEKSRFEKLLSSHDTRPVAGPSTPTAEAERTECPDLSGVEEELARERLRAVAIAEFAEQSLGASQQFTEGEVHELLSAFQHLGTETMEVRDRASGTFSALLDPASATSLTGIVTESREIAGVLRSFFASLDHLHEDTRKVLQAHSAEMAKVDEMAQTIAEFFENIRMISLNLSIEASRVGSSTGGKALQVLAQRLREFSNQAQEISAQQQATVAGATHTVKESEDRLHREFSTFEGRILPLQSRLDAFPEIIARAHDSFDKILETLSRLAGSVQSVLTERLGHLQFQDLTRQEHEHLVALFHSLNERGRPGPFPAEWERQEKLHLAQDFSRRTTTNNERELLIHWSTTHGLPLDQIDIQGDDREAGSVVLF